MQDRDGAVPLLAHLRRGHRQLTWLWADGGYAGQLVEWAAQQLRLTIDIVRRGESATGFVVLPRRWLVERTLAWLMRSRRLVRDYERRPVTHQVMVLWSMSMLMGRRLAKRPQRAGAVNTPRCG
ncbi:transposase [Streptomyces boninensis]|uniref:transposase n=1 Tax=Streptomyces boninensis TaxID=2039455 RepID=UPI003B21A3F1